MYKHLLYEEKGKVAKLTLNRPETYNALNTGLKEELTDAFNSVQKNPNLHCILLTGAGDKAFCSGQDLKESMVLGPQDAEKWVRSFDSLYAAIRNFEKPYVAAVNGVSTGSGFQLPLLADVRICSDNAKFAMTEIDVGYACIIGTTLMWDILGRGKTTEMILLGNFLYPDEALQRGLVTKVVPYAELAKESLALANMLADKAPISLKNNKKWFRHLTEENFTKCIQFAIGAHTEGYAAGEPNEYQRRFFEARKAKRTE